MGKKFKKISTMVWGFWGLHDGKEEDEDLFTPRDWGEGKTALRKETREIKAQA